MEREEFTVVGPHADMIITKNKEELKKAILEVIQRNKLIRSGEIWKKVGCHLWELNEALRELKEEGKIIEV